MTTATNRTARGAPVRRASASAVFPEDQLYRVKLCLELQLEALLLDPRSSAASASTRSEQSVTRRDDLPWEKWLGEDLELAYSFTRDCVDDGVPLPSSMGIVNGTGSVIEALAARYSAMAAVIDEMLDRIDPHDYAVAVARLVDVRARCGERLDALLGEAPHPPVHLIAPSSVAGLYLG